MYTNLTLADCLQSLADRHDNGVLPTSSVTLSFYTRLLNRGVLYCADRLRLTKTTSLTTTSGTVALPDDFITRDSVFLNDTEYTLVDPTDTTQQVGTVYWITGNQTDGFDFNVPEDDTYTVSYVFRPAKMTTNADICIIPDIEAVVAYAYARLRKGESDPFEDAAESLQECDARLKEIQSVNSINNDAIGFTIE